MVAYGMAFYTHRTQPDGHLCYLHPFVWNNVSKQKHLRYYKMSHEEQGVNEAFHAGQLLDENDAVAPLVVAMGDSNIFFRLLVHIESFTNSLFFLRHLVIS